MPDRVGDTGECYGAQLSDALAHLFHDVRYSMIAGEPITYVPIPPAIPLMQAWLAWLQLAPSGDDWAEPIDPPAEIRVPPDAADPTPPVGLQGG